MCGGEEGAGGRGQRLQLLLWLCVLLSFVRWASVGEEVACTPQPLRLWLWIVIFQLDFRFGHLFQGEDSTSGTMQSVINTVKGTALGVAEYLAPVLKVGA